MELRFVRVVRVEENKRSFFDQRHRVIWTLCEYLGSDGEIYRKAFESKDTAPDVLEKGTHQTINAAKKQWN